MPCCCAFRRWCCRSRRWSSAGTERATPCKADAPSVDHGPLWSVHGLRGENVGPFRNWWALHSNSGPSHSSGRSGTGSARLHCAPGRRRQADRVRRWRLPAPMAVEHEPARNLPRQRDISPGVSVWIRTSSVAKHVALRMFRSRAFSSLRAKFSAADAAPSSRRGQIIAARSRRLWPMTIGASSLLPIRSCRLSDQRVGCGAAPREGLSSVLIR